MGQAETYIAISSIGLVSALILLIFPKINYVIKAILTALVTTFLGYISINLFAWNTVHIVNDKHGIIVLISFTYGLIVSIFGGLSILAILIAKMKKWQK